MQREAWLQVTKGNHTILKINHINIYYYSPGWPSQRYTKEKSTRELGHGERARMLAIMFLTCICPFMKRSFFSSSKVSYFISKAHFLKHTLLLLDLPAVKEEIIVQKQKPSTSALSDLPTASASSDLRNIIVSRKRKANDSRKVARKFYICSMLKLVLKYNYRCPERI